MNAADVMTRNVVAVGPDDTVAHAVELMLERHISGLPVIGAEGALTGIVTEGDLLRRSETGTQKRRARWLEFLLGPGRMAAEYAHASGRKVNEVMTPDVVAIAEDTPLDEVVRIMEKRQIKRLPVLRDGRLVGIVSRANLIRALASAPSEAAATADDATIQQRIIAEMEKTSWAPVGTVNVIVRDGVAHLWGTIIDDRERQGLRVVAENTPGVKAVKDHLVFVEPMSGIAIPSPEDEAANPKAS